MQGNMLKATSDCSSKNFFLQIPEDNVNSEFLNRQKNVFDKLDAVAKVSEKTISTQNSLKRENPSERSKQSKRQRHDTQQFRGKESIFKRPEPPPPSRFSRNVPDYQRNPNKWTKYTLSDVSQEDMSDKSNTAAAMSFLQELRAKKESECMDMDTEVKAITFRKPSSCGPNYRSTSIPDVSNKEKYDVPSFRSSKVVMPEYVVGEKKSSNKSSSQLKPTEKSKSCKEIKLDHLIEEDE